jgi:hypothetical protein
MTPCIEFGLYRHSNYGESTIKSELEERLFWSCYYPDREMSMALCRPPAISDGDIDVELPTIDPAKIYVTTKNISNAPSNPATSLTSFIHHLRLKRIESKTQFTI